MWKKQFTVNGYREGAPALTRCEKQAESGNRHTKETKCDGKSVWDSERSIVPVKRGNPPEGTPWREGGSRVMKAAGGGYGANQKEPAVLLKREPLDDAGWRIERGYFLSK
jgi:hypothetical protein